MDFYLGGMCYQSKISRQDNDILPFEVIQRVSKLEYTPKVKLINKNGKTQYVVIDNPDKTCKDITDINYNNRPKVPFTFIEGLVFSKDKTYLEDIDKEYTEGHSCLVVCRLKDSCRLIEEELKKLNIKTQILYGDSKEAKDVLLDRANKDRHLVTIATVNMVSEGTNCNQWEVLIPVLSVANGKDIEQLIGRVRRLKPNNKLKKARVYEYSFPKVYTLNNHIEHRMARYKKLKAYGLEDNSKFGRGYK